MKSYQKFISNLYLIGSLLLLSKAILMLFSQASWQEIFHLAFYAPVIAMLSVISGQIDMLKAIRGGEKINIKARALDFIHWLLLIFINIGAWMVDAVSIWWFILKIFLLIIIGWQIGVGVNRQWVPTYSEKLFGTIFAVFACILGLSCGIIRNVDSSPLGWGWGIEAITAITATMIVLWWIVTDIKTFSVRAKGYPRSAFLKGIYCNSLIIWFWLHVMSQIGISDLYAWKVNLGLTFNTIVGNIIYLGYYFYYEYYIARQRE
jgi:hypothetical protein